MKNPEEIAARVKELKDFESDLVQKITTELTHPKKTDAIVATVNFYNSQRKLTQAKIEELEWVLPPATK